MHKLLALTLLLLGLSVASEAAPQQRILGGQEAAAANSVPYAVSLRIDNGHVCGASIISERHLLTAAHCLHREGKLIDLGRLSVRVGSINQFAGGRIVTPIEVTVHPEYDNLHNNLAVITLGTTLAFTDRIQPIKLIDKSAMPAAGAEITVAGWGSTNDGLTAFKIRQLNLHMATDDACLDAYSGHDPAKSFCLAHDLKEGTCTGDGGSAAVYNSYLIGLSNFVVGACGSRYPDVFLRISGYNDWVEEQLQN